MEAETGLYDYGARHYDPKLAEFLVPDEVILGNGLNPQGYNLTAYVLNQPLRFIDPTGRFPLEGVESFFSENAENLLAMGGAIFHFAGGFVDGIAPIPLNTQPDPNYELAFAGGQIVGGLVGIVVDAWLMANGAAVGVGGGAACATGVGCLVGAPAAGAGAAMAVGGMAAATTNHIPSIREGANKLIHQMSSVGDGGGASKGGPRLLPERAGPTAHISPSEVAGKTPAQIDARARQLGLEARGPDAAGGRGAYIDPQTGQQRILSHPNATPPHGHVNNPAGQRIDINGNVVPPESPGAHLPIKVN